MEMLGQIHVFSRSVGLFFNTERPREVSTSTTDKSCSFLRGAKLASPQSVPHPSLFGTYTPSRGSLDVINSTVLR